MKKISRRSFLMAAGLGVAALGLAAGVERLESVGGHQSLVTRSSSSIEVMPAATSRSPSSRIERRPAPRAAAMVAAISTG